MRFTPLDELGQAIKERSDTIAADSTGYVTFQLDQSNQHTLWFGIESLNYKEPEIPVDTTLSIPELADHIVKVYPNPTRDLIHIALEGNGEKNATISIFNLTGNLVFSHLIKDHLTIQTDFMLPGTYYYHLQEKRRMISGKIVLMD